MKYFILIVSTFTLIACVFFVFKRGDREQLVADSINVPSVKNSKAEQAASANLSSQVNPRQVASLVKNDIQSELMAASSGEWQFSQNEEGRVLRMTGGSLSLGEPDPVLAAHRFLTKYGQKLFGLPAESASLVSVNRETDSSQVIFEQINSGLKVYGTRVNLFFDDKGSLIYAISDTCPTASNNGVAGAISADAAAKIARTELIKFLKLPDISSAYSEAGLAANMEKALRCSGDRLSSIYRSIVPLEAPNFGDMEIEVDALSGSVTKMKNLARK